MKLIQFKRWTLGDVGVKNTSYNQMSSTYSRQDKKQFFFHSTTMIKWCLMALDPWVWVRQIYYHKLYNACRFVKMARRAKSMQVWLRILQKYTESTKQIRIDIIETPPVNVKQNHCIGLSSLQWEFPSLHNIPTKWRNNILLELWMAVPYKIRARSPAPGSYQSIPDTLGEHRQNRQVISQVNYNESLVVKSKIKWSVTSR